MSRRGQAELLVYIFRFLLIGLLAFLLSVQIGFFTNIETPTSDLEAELIMQRLLVGPNGLAEREAATGEMLPGTVDFSRITSLELTRIYDEGFGEDDFWGGRVSLYLSRTDLDAEKNSLKNATFPLRVDEKTPNPVDFLELAKAGVRGSGGAIYYTQTFPVQLRRQPDDKREAGWLRIELVKKT